MSQRNQNQNQNQNENEKQQPEEQQNVAANVDQYTDDLSAEATQAVEQLAATVDQAARAADEAMDLGDEVTAVLDPLSRGDRRAAVDAGLSLLSDESGKEAKETAAALKATRKELDQSWDELVDVADMLADAATEVAEDAQKSKIYQTLADLFGERSQ